jgi:hypothetical protein
MEGGQAVSLEEQLRKDAESMREVGWFNRAKMYTAAADEIHRLEDRIKRLEEAGDAMVSHAKALGMDGTGLVKRWSKAKEAKP